MIPERTDTPIVGRRFEEFDPVRLATDAYADRGWLRGRPGHIVEVYEKHGERRYGIEFDDYDDLECGALFDSVATGFRAGELELIEPATKE